MSLRDIVREFRELPIACIDEPALPSRSEMDEQKLDELTRSIREIGLQQPIIVARIGERFEVVAGHRRRIASGRAGLLTVPCIVYPSKVDALDAVQFAENRHREELNPADEAIWFAELLQQKCGGDIEQLCGLVGETLNYVDNRLALFGGDADVFEALRAGRIGIGVAHELNKCPDAHYRRYYLDCAVRGGATVSTVAGWVSEWRQNFGTDRPAPPPAPTPSVIVPQASHDPHRCYVCGKSDPRFIPETILVHTHCKHAILEPLLDAAQQGGDRS